MNGVRGVLVVGVLAAFLSSGARADVPPPKGLKRVPLDSRITTEKEYPEVAFFLLSGGDKVEPVKLDPKNPLVIEGAARGGRYRFVQFVTVPKDAGKKYDSEKAFHEAIARGKVEGQRTAKQGFSTLTTIKDTDSRKSVVFQYRLEKIDPKDGPVITSPKEEGPTSSPPPKGGEEEAAYAPRNGVWVAALAATLGLVFAGLWLAGRNRHR